MLLAVLRQIGDAGGDGVAWGADGERLAIDANFARGGGDDAEEGAGDVGAARPDQPREADNLAGADVETGVREPPAGEAVDVERKWHGFTQSESASAGEAVAEFDCLIAGP